MLDIVRAEDELRVAQPPNGRDVGCREQRFENDDVKNALPEVVLDDVNGITFDIADEVGLLSALEALLADKALRDTLGAGGSQLARSEFSIDAMVEGNLEIYQSVLDN